MNDTIGVVIERVGNKILPFLPTLAQAIPALWHGCSGLEGEWLFKASLVVLTTKLVGVSNCDSTVQDWLKYAGGERDLG